MDSITIVWMLWAYLLLGYFWTLIFRNYVLKDMGGDWLEGEFGPGSAILVTICWPAMALVVGFISILIALGWLVDHTGPGIRKLYGLPEKRK